MMMLRRTDATPCPGGQPTYRARPRDSIISLGGDNTEDIDFTTEFRASLRAIKPRRRQTAISTKRRGVEVDFAIHEDRETQPTDGISLKGSILAKPPQRPRQRVAFLPEIKEPETEQRWHISDSRSSTARVSATSMSQNGAADPVAAPDPVKREGTMKRPARRGTVYIPSDDTTMPSMHMGIFSPIKELQIGARAGEDKAAVELTGLAAQMAKKRGRRESLVALPAKRVPLQQPRQVRQESASPRAVAGKRTGKENIPPGQHDKHECDLDETKLFDLSQPSVCRRRTSVLYPQQVAESRPGIAGHKKVRVDVAMAKEGFQSADHPKPSLPQLGAATHVKEIKRYQNRPSQPVPSCANRRSSLRPFAPVIQSASRLREESVPAKLSVPRVQQNDLRQQYPVLSENIADTSLYEDSWLTHQEIAITQLVNTLFQTSQGSKVVPEGQQVRQQLLAVHQGTNFSLLHKRLQASLLYGALRIPKEVLARGSRLWTDLGRREKFCSFWLDTYDLVYLTAALEVVVGRECIRNPRASPDGESDGLASYSTLCTGAGRGPKSNCTLSRRTVRTFLETFLVRNEDGSPEAEITNHEAWSYQRTLLRSLVLVKLLDGAKAVCSSPSSFCLFLPTSPFKCSTAVVKSLAQMLNPGVGDVLRLLGHLDYTVNHKQYPLEEYHYHIENLAVDLRDGVVLTRLVELLLYPTASHLLARTHDAEGSTTVLMPGGETLCLLQGEHDWPLSQHLKFPCLGHATKLYNVQLALSALRGVRGLDSLISDVRAEDVVNGFREKTVALLWGLTGKWGLGSLLDWADVRNEIRRLSRPHQVEDEECLDDSEEGFEDRKRGLKAWASAVATKHGLEVKNLSTSFSDGRVFHAIVEEYSQYLDNVSGGGGPDLVLHERLERLGCSGQFVKLFVPAPGVPPGRFFDRDFVVAALAFLCSRLLSATKQARAAVTIQRRWRLVYCRQVMQRRRVAKHIADQCMAVVHAREQLVWAKTVIWHFWRTYR